MLSIYFKDYSTDVGMYMCTVVLILSGKYSISHYTLFTRSALVFLFATEIARWLNHGNDNAIVYCMYSPGVSSTILQGPQNKTVSTFSTVSFQCKSEQSSEIFWRYKHLYIFDDRGRNKKVFSERFVKRVNGSSSILTISDVQKSDSGVYSCVQRDSFTGWSAQLTVIGWSIIVFFSTVLAYQLI